MAYTDFIPQNVAPLGTRCIGVYNEQGNRAGYIPLDGLALPDSGQKLYSFGALSDVHIGYDTSVQDLQKALTFLKNEENAAFTCICGDLTGDGSDAQLAQ